MMNMLHQGPVFLNRNFISYKALFYINADTGFEKILTGFVKIRHNILKKRCMGRNCLTKFWDYIFLSRTIVFRIFTK